MDVVSLRFSCDVGWQRSGREGWPSCMIKSRRGGRERPKTQGWAGVNRQSHLSPARQDRRIAFFEDIVV